MWAVHDNAGIAMVSQTVLVPSESCLVEIRVAVDLNFKRVFRSCVTLVSTFIAHNDAKAGISVADERHHAGFLFSLLDYFRKMVARIVVVDHIGIVFSQITARVRCRSTQVEFNLVDAFGHMIVKLVHGGEAAIFTTNKNSHYGTAQTRSETYGLIGS